jgi:hypothetical protein
LATRLARRKKMSKAMSKVIGGHNLRAAVVMALIAVLLLVTLVVVIEPAASTSNRDDNPAISGTGRPSLRDDPYIDSHDDPYIDRHAEVVARYHQGSLH